MGSVIAGPWNPLADEPWPWPAYFVNERYQLMRADMAAVPQAEVDELRAYVEKLGHEADDDVLRETIVRRQCRQIAHMRVPTLSELMAYAATGVKGWLDVAAPPQESA